MSTAKLKPLPGEPRAEDSPWRVTETDLLTTEQASEFLRGRNCEISVATLNARRSYMKAPKWLKLGHGVYYRREDLIEFTRMVGLKGLPERQPERAIRKAKRD
jgi:hypothetical protein